MYKLKKIGSISMIALSLLFVVPQNTNAQYVDVVQAVKEGVGDPIAYYVANKMIERISAQTVNWINSGFEGKPGFVKDPGQFFLSVGDNVASQFLSGHNLNALCTPFKAQVRLALVKNYLSDTSNGNFSCSLSILKNNYESFKTDFTKGGWEGWLEITQNDNNNPYGAYFSAQSSLLKQINEKTQKTEKELEQGKGILSMKTCPAGHKLTQSDVDAIKAGTYFMGAKGQVELNPDTVKVGDCNVEKETTTPGSVIESKLNQVLGSGQGRLEAADEINEVIGALLNQLVSRIVGGKGNGLAGAAEPGPGGSYADQLRDNPMQSPSSQSSTPASVTCRTGDDGVMTCSADSQPPVTTCTQDENGKETCVTEEVPTATTGGGDPGTPNEEPTGLSAMCNSVSSERAKFASSTGLSKQDIRTILNNVAGANNANGWGLLSKTSGNNCDGVSCDILFHGPTCYIYDVLVDVEGKSSPSCNFSGGNMDRGRWVGVGSDTKGSGSCATVTPAGTTPPVTDQTDHTPPTTGIRSDLSNVNIVGPGSSRSVGSWRVTSNIQEFGFTPSGDGSTMHIKHTKSGLWTPVNADGAMQEATLWIFFYINGHWTTTGSERLRPNQIDKPEVKPSKLSNDWFYNNSWAPMGGGTGYSPKPGEYVGIMVTSGNQRADDDSNEQERSNIVLVKWPSDTDSGLLSFVTLPN